MAYVTVPKDLTQIKNKLVFNLTKRQIICFAVSAAAGLPFYFLTQDAIGTSSAATGMVLLMAPGFLFDMYQKDGLPLEVIIRNIVTTKYLRPRVRRYEMVNYFDTTQSGPPARAARKGTKRVQKKGPR